jgi:hypothetical protein
LKLNDQSILHPPFLALTPNKQNYKRLNNLALLLHHMEENSNVMFIETGYCSRREADKILKRSRDYQWYRSRAGHKVSPSDEVRIDGKLIREKTDKSVYLLLQTRRNRMHHKFRCS